jgi:4-amino-4-deoxy-L-arabinose transferase-like glycosyltransferase
MRRQDEVNIITVSNLTPSWSWKAGVSLACLLSLFLLLQSFLPLRTAVLIGADEGFEVAKATLCLKGYKLYTDIWNDQPPLHTFLLTQTMRRLSSTMLGPRLITSAFSLLLLASVFLLCWRVSGARVATIATLLLLASPSFLTLGSSCMLEIPALAPTLAALCVLALGHQSRWLWAEVASGVLFGLALEIKLISLVLLPMAALLVWLNRRHDSFPGWSVTKSLLVLSVVLVASTIATDVVASHGAYLSHFQQSWASHFGGTKSHEYGSPGDHRFNWAALLVNWDLTIPAVLGVVISVRPVARSRSAVVPLIWLAYSFIIFGFHRPWWNYYYVHTAIPLCWCAALGLEAVWAQARWPQARFCCVALALYVQFAGAWMAGRLCLEIQSVRDSPQTYTCLFLNEIERYKPQTRWLYSEEPMYSFLTGIPLPPDLAVVVMKRFWSGEMTGTRLTEDLRSSKPELMLLRNDTNPRPFRELLDAEYQLTYIDADNRLYVRKAMVRPLQR